MHAVVGFLPHGQTAVDEGLVQSLQQDVFILFRSQSFHAVQSEPGIFQVVFGDHADSVRSVSQRAGDGSGVAIDPFGVEQHKAAKVQFPDQSRTGQSPDDGVQLFGFEA